MDFWDLEQDTIRFLIPNMQSIFVEALLQSIYNQHVKDDTGRIKNFCNLTISINPDKFKIELSKHISSDMNVFDELEKCIFKRE